MDNYTYIARWVASLGHGNGPLQVLDYGCGQGVVVKLLREQGFECSGCDAFVQMSKRPEDYVLRREWFGSVIRDMPDGRIPFSDRSFDVVVNNQVMEHVEDIERTLAEIHRVLRPGGLVLSLFPDRSVWREGHCGVAFLHWFPKRSRARYYYALACRSLGLGYHKQKLGSIRNWALNRCRYLDEQTFYRSLPDIHRTYGRYFENLRHCEAAFLKARFGERIPLLGVLPDVLLARIVRIAAGCVFSCRKPAEGAERQREPVASAVASYGQSKTA